MQTFKLLSDDTVMLSQPQLVKRFGRAGAQLLSQLHYWINKKKSLGVNHQGVKWVYNTAEEWAKQLQLSVRHVRRLIAEFVEAGILRVEKLNKVKSIRTNYYSIDYDQLNISLQTSNLILCTGENNKNTDKMSSSSCQNVTMYIEAKTTNKDFNKSEKIEKSQVKQVKNLKTKLEIDKLEQSNPSLSVIKNSTAQDMLKIWNECLGNKAEAKMSKDLAPKVVAAFKTKFESSLGSWKNYCELIKSSSYLMSESFELNINWALKFATIERIRAGELGVKLTTEGSCMINDDQVEGMIEALPETALAKVVRQKIAKSIGAAAYYSWFHQAKFHEIDGDICLEASNAFVEQYWETNFPWVNKAQINK